MSDTLTITTVQVGDLVHPLSSTPYQLADYYREDVGRVIGMSGAQHDGTPEWIEVQFDRDFPRAECDRLGIGYGHSYAFTGWSAVTAAVGDTVRVTRCQDGASEDYKRLATGRRGVVAAINYATFTVKFDEPFMIDTEEWASGAASTVALIERAKPVEEAPLNPIEPVIDAASLRREIASLEATYDLLQDALSEEATEQEWCGEFEDFCSRNGIESRRKKERTYEFRVSLTYSKTVDEMVDYIEGTSCPSDSERVRFTYVVNFTRTTIDPDDVDIADALSDEGYSNWEDYDLLGYDEQ